MTIIIAGTMDFDPSFLPDAIISAKPLIDAALLEKGCLHYRWAIDPVHEGRVNVFEEWEDEASLKAHFEGAPYKDMLAHLPMDKIRGFDVSKYRFDVKEPVYDSDGKPRADFFTAA